MTRPNTLISAAVGSRWPAQPLLKLRCRAGTTQSGLTVVRKAFTLPKQMLQGGLRPGILRKIQMRTEGAWLNLTTLCNIKHCRGKRRPAEHHEALTAVQSPTPCNGTASFMVSSSCREAHPRVTPSLVEPPTKVPLAKSLAPNLLKSRLWQDLTTCKRKPKVEIVMLPLPGFSDRPAVKTEALPAGFRPSTRSPFDRTGHSSSEKQPANWPTKS